MIQAKTKARQIHVDRAAVGQRIRRARESRGMTALDLARACGLTRGETIYRYEEGGNLPETETVVRLAVTLRRSIDFLLLGLTKRGSIATYQRRVMKRREQRVGANRTFPSSDATTGGGGHASPPVASEGGTSSFRKVGPARRSS